MVLVLGRVGRNVLGEIDVPAANVRAHVGERADRMAAARAIRKTGFSRTDDGGIDLFRNGCGEHHLRAIELVAVVRRDRADDQPHHA